jgi:hypothetical protein
MEMDKILSLFKSNQNIGLELKSRIRSKGGNEDMNLGESFDRLRRIIDKAKRKQSWDFRNHQTLKK